jgi:hypothetical protein
MKTQFMNKMNSLEKYRRTSESPIRPSNLTPPPPPFMHPSDLISQDFSVAARLEIQNLVQDRDNIAYKFKQSL